MDDGKRYAGNDCCLLKGNALELLGSIPSESVDMVLTDPPYGTTDAAWDKAPPWSALFEQLWRALKQYGALLMFAQNPLAARIICMQPRTFRYEWVWVKSMATGMLNVRRMPLRAHELVLVFYRRLPRYNAAPIEHQRRKPYRKGGGREAKSELYGRYIKTGCGSVDGARFPRDVLHYSRDAKKWGHPTQKPLELCKDLIRQYTLPGDTVLDPFAGSGTTLAAAQELGRKAIGIELNAQFCEVIRTRCNL